MHDLYAFVRGPLAWVAFIIFIGGSLYRVISMLRLAKKKDVWVYEYTTWRYALRSIIHWIVPFAHISYSGMSHSVSVGGRCRTAWRTSWPLSWWYPVDISYGED